MANPQVDKFTKISNELLEALAKIRIAGEARQMLDVIIRKTYGFNKKEDRISTSQFMYLTGLSDRSIHKARKKLLDLNLITIPKKGHSQVLTYRIQKDYHIWQPYPKKTIPKKGDTQKGPELYPKRAQTIPKKGTPYILQKKERHITKERGKKEHSLGPKDKQGILKRQNHYAETYGITKAYIQTFFEKCEAKSNKYKYTDFGKTLIVWWKGDSPDWEKDIKSQRERPRGLLNPDQKCPNCKGSGSVIKKGNIIENCDCIYPKGE